MRIILSLAISLIFCYQVNGQFWTGKFKMIPDASNDDCLIVQVVPDVDGTDQMNKSGTVLHIWAPDNLSYTATDINASWEVKTLGNQPSNGGSNVCGDLIQATMNTSYNPGSWTAGQAVDLFRICVTTPSTCESDEFFRFLEGGEPMNEPSDPCTGTTYDNGITVGANSGGYSGNLNGVDNPLTCLTVLPVTLVSFEAAEKGSYTHLSWTTASELNNSHFDVERSVDGKSWTTIGKVEGNGTTSDLINYVYIDDAPMSENYYRLKQVDYDGRYEYSDVRYVRFANIKAAAVYPNPFLSEISISTGGYRGSIVLEVLDVTGKVIYDETTDTRTVDLSRLKAGVYFMSVQDREGGLLLKQRVIKVD